MEPLKIEIAPSFYTFISSPAMDFLNIDSNSTCGCFIMAVMLLLFAVAAIPVLYWIAMIFYWGIITMIITGATMVFGIL